MKMSPQERFTLKIKIMPNGCWEWQGQRKKEGYGQFHLKPYGTMTASRAAWILKYGPIKKQKHVLHSCDNPPCCNADHLFLGTNLENVKDMIKKGRQAKGEKNGKAKLTENQIKEIRKVYASRKSRYWGAKRLSEKFGVDASAITLIATRKTWNHTT